MDAGDYSTDEVYAVADSCRIRELNYAQLVYEGVEAEKPNAVMLQILGRRQPFPKDARRGCLLHGRDAYELARRVEAKQVGFDIVNGRAVIRGVDAGDHCNGPAVVVF